MMRPMGTLHPAVETVETCSPAEDQFNRRWRTAGLFLAPAAFVTVRILPLGGLSPAAHTMAAIMALVVVLWLTEALPIAVTAMLGPMLAVVLGVAPAREALAPFANPIIFLFIGSFILAQAMFVHGVDRRFAYTALSSRVVGTSAARMLLIYSAVCASLSMWMSNTATTAMMFPIGLSIIAHLIRTTKNHQAEVRRFGMAIMLMTAFAASVGGMGTPVGSPPNLIGIGMLEKIVGYKIPFFSWMAMGVPIVVLLLAYLMAQFYFSSVRGLPAFDGSTDLVREEFAKLGKLTPGQRNVIIAFAATVTLWVAPGVFAIAGLDESPMALTYAVIMPEGVAAMVGAFLLFLLPVDWRNRRFTLTWNEALKIDWGIVLLYGGGLAVGELAFSSGLAQGHVKVLGR